MTWGVIRGCKGRPRPGEIRGMTWEPTESTTAHSPALHGDGGSPPFRPIGLCGQSGARSAFSRLIVYSLTIGARLVQCDIQSVWIVYCTPLQGARHDTRRRDGEAARGQRDV